MFTTFFLSLKKKFFSNWIKSLSRRLEKILENRWQSLGFHVPVFLVIQKLRNNLKSLLFEKSKFWIATKKYIWLYCKRVRPVLKNILWGYFTKKLAGLPASLWHFFPKSGNKVDSKQKTWHLQELFHVKFCTLSCGEILLFDISQ